MPDVTMQQMETFLTVADHMSFSDAARAMFISQPALSKAIIRLEEALETPLFVRSSRGVKMTPEGEYLYTQLRPLFEKIYKALRNTRDMRGAGSRALRIGFHTSYASYTGYEPVGDAIRRFESERPDTLVTEELYEFRELTNALVWGSVDMAVMAEYAARDLEGVVSRPLFELDLYVAAPPSHPLAAGSELDFAALSDERFVFITPSESRAKNNELERCEQLGFRPREVLYLPNFASVLAAVRAGRGLTMCAYTERPSRDGGLRFFKAPRMGQDLPRVVAAWRENDISNEAQALLDLLPQIETIE